MGGFYAIHRPRQRQSFPQNRSKTYGYKRGIILPHKIPCSGGPDAPRQPRIDRAATGAFPLDPAALWP
jgi:hypothetical protein